MNFTYHLFFCITLYMDVYDNHCGNICTTQAHENKHRHLKIPSEMKIFKQISTGFLIIPSINHKGVDFNGSGAHVKDLYYLHVYSLNIYLWDFYKRILGTGECQARAFNVCKWQRKLKEDFQVDTLK